MLVVSDIKTNNILVLKGVYILDFSTDNLPTTVTTEFTGRPTTYTRYISLPKQFISPDDWPKVSNLKCWSCDRLFESYPKFVPLDPELISLNDKLVTAWEPRGNFCGWNCVIDYIRTRLPKNKQWDAEQDTCKVAEMFAKAMSAFAYKPVIRIMPSPEKTLMKPYCGNDGITEEEYQSMVNALNTNYDLSSYKMEHYHSSD